MSVYGSFLVLKWPDKSIFIWFLNNTWEVVFHKRGSPRGFGEQGNMSLFLGNRGTKLYKLEDENIESKFITRGTHTENVQEHGNIGQFWKGTRTPPPLPLGDPHKICLSCENSLNTSFITHCVAKRLMGRSLTRVYVYVSNYFIINKNANLLFYVFLFSLKMCQLM